MYYSLCLELVLVIKLLVYMINCISRVHTSSHLLNLDTNYIVEEGYRICAGIYILSCFITKQVIRSGLTCRLLSLLLGALRLAKHHSGASELPTLACNA